MKLIFENEEEKFKTMRFLQEIDRILENKGFGKMDAWDAMRALERISLGGVNLDDCDIDAEAIANCVVEWRGDDAPSPLP